RAPVGEGYDVRSDWRIHPADPPKVAIVDYDGLRDRGDDLLDALLAMQDAVTIVLRASRPGPAIAEARELGLDRALVVSKSIPMREIIAHLRDGGDEEPAVLEV